MAEYITKENEALLRKELAELTGPRRKEVVAQIEYAKSLGDLSENAEYHQAREDQGKLEDRIATIEHILRTAEIVEPTAGSTIAIGSTVTVQKSEESNTRVFQIVGSEETDMLSGKISYKSPLGAALMGKKVGDTALVITPKGEIGYTIIGLQ